MLLTFQLAFGLVCSAAALQQRQSTEVSGHAIVNLGHTTGTPQYLASGFINGIPATYGQIPDKFYQGIKFQFARNSGGQVGSSGWIVSIEGYEARFNSSINDYNTARAQGGSFIMPLHNLWGAGSSNKWPGDNGDWTEYDKFLDRVFSDWKKSGAAADPKFYTEIWNEPDLTGSWNSTMTQWLDMWDHAYTRMGDDLPHIKILGPTLTTVPSTNNKYWAAWSERVASTKHFPDQYTWHMEPGSTGMETALLQLDEVRQKYGLPQRTININEYGALNEQVPSGAAWYISQLERINAIGLRGNWFTGAGPLHDYMAGLVGKPHANTTEYVSTESGYWPAAEYQVYKYYANMEGSRVDSAPTPDKRGSVYATVGGGYFKVLAGSNKLPGQWSIDVADLAAIGLGSSGSISVQKYIFPGEENHFAKYDAPIDAGTTKVSYSCDKMTIQVPSTDGFEAYAFQFKIPERY